MRKLILMAIATFVWKKIQARNHTAAPAGSAGPSGTMRR